MGIVYKSARTSAYASAYTSTYTSALPTQVDIAMRCRRFFVVSTLIYVTAAISYNGSSSNFFASVVDTPQNAVSGLYKGCSEEDAVGKIVSSGYVCVARIVSCMLEAVATVSNDNYAIAGASSGNTSFYSGAQPTGATRKRDSLMTAADRRDALRRRWENEPQTGQRIRIRDVVHSKVHPQDGVAFETNVRNGDTTLHVHTNGSHLMARFDPLQSLSVRKREGLDTDGSIFQFSNVAGIKIEAHGGNSNGDNLDYGPDMTAFSFAFAYGDGTAAEFENGDLWSIAACRINTDQPVFEGAIIAELNPFNTQYRSVPSQPCAA